MSELLKEDLPSQHHYQAVARAECRGLRDQAFECIRLEKDYEFAVDCLRKCVEGYSTLTPDATLSEVYYALGYACDNGLGMKRDRTQAKTWIALGARLGNAQAAARLRAGEASERRRSRLDLVLVVLGLAAAWTLGALYDVLRKATEEDERSDEIDGSDARTVREVEWIGPLANREALLAKALRLLDKNALSDSFEGTRGVVVHFTRAALEDPYAFGGPLRWLRDGFVAQHLDPRCNAFVFNVLVVPPGRGRGDVNNTGVGAHIDQTLIQPVTHAAQTAFHVSVGYMRVPEPISGGTINVDHHKYKPKEGQVLRFRGSLLHSVSSFCVGTDTLAKPMLVCPRDESLDKARVSFVLENYRLPPEKLRRSASFIFSPTGHEDETLSAINALPLGPYLVELYLQVRKRLLRPVVSQPERTTQTQI